jgi:acetyl esterase
VSTTEERDATRQFLEELAAVAPADGDLRADDVAAQREQAERGTEPVWRRHAEPGPEVAEVAEVTIPSGAHQLRARVYRPIRTGRAGQPSLHLTLHGGGWWHGSVDQWIVDAQCRERADLGDAVVVSVDYRKAPEHPFPAAVDDAVAALRWATDHRAELDASERTTVSGASAGANLAAALAIRSLDGGPTIDHLVLEALPADLRPEADTFWTGPDGGGIDRAAVADLLRWYLPDPADAAHPLASPLLAPDLAGFPPATLLIGDRDPLVGGATAFADRLAAAGVPARLIVFPGFAHHTCGLTRTVAEARRWRSIVAAAIAGADGS